MVDITSLLSIDRSVAILHSEVTKIRDIVFGTNQINFIYDLRRIRSSFTICFIRIDILQMNTTDSSLLEKIGDIRACVSSLENSILYSHSQQPLPRNSIDLDKSYATLHRNVKNDFCYFFDLIKNFDEMHRTMNYMSSPAIA